MERTITIGFLGCGNVGGGVWKLLNGFEDLIILRHQAAFFCRIFNRTSHITDQCKFTSKQMSVRFCIHQHTQRTDRRITVSGKRTSKGRSQNMIYFCVQIINTIGKFCIYFMIDIF